MVSPTPTKTLQSAPKKTYKLMLIAAEASGDGLGADLIDALRQQASDYDLHFVGIGGARMQALGIKSPFDIAELSILGIIEGLKAYGRVKARVEDTLILAQTEQPDAVILIDSWGFTLRVAQGLRRLMPCVPLIKYVGPQVWATRPGRAKTLAQSVDLLLALHPMDAPYFEREGLETVVVGNPALNLDFSKVDAEAYRTSLGIKPEDQVLLVLPGSRPSEIHRLMPVFNELIQDLRQDRPDLKIILAIADTVATLISSYLKAEDTHVILAVTEEDKRSAMKAADLALACSGTVTTELALAGCPMVVAYKVEPLTALIFQLISPLQHITLFNIVAGKTIAPEFIQGDCTPKALLEALKLRLDDKTLRFSQTQAQYKALDLMGRGQEAPSNLAARAVLKHLKLSPAEQSK
jgi:lipid-A-disaccharide synthase